MKPCFWMSIILGFVALLALAAAPVAGLETGNHDEMATVGDTQLQLYTYRPADCSPNAFLIVFHGVGRNADSYRDSARPLADRLCLIVIAPLFDKHRFPTWRYQKGGLAYRGELQPPENWTGQYVPKLVAWVRQTEGNPYMPYYLIGHSGGAQFLSRVAAVIPNQALRIVVANPSTYVLPCIEVDPPFGLRGLPNADELLRHYLAQPVVILLGQEDEGSKELDESHEAEAQGRNRFERGEQTFRAAQDVAQAHGWPFNWRLIEVPGVGHSAKSMFDSPQALDALTLAPPLERHP
jgi:dienelactone hydrolase